MRVVISSGHGARIAGAGGYIQEVAEARRVVAATARYLRNGGASVTEFHDDASATVAADLAAIVAFHNGRSRDLDVSVHFNHSGGSNVERAIGTEVLYVTQGELAARVSKAIAQAGGLIDRGAKKRADLAFLSRTTAPAILAEICFTNSKADTDLYKANFEPICAAFAGAVLAKSISPQVPEPPPTLPAPQEVTITVHYPKGVRVILKEI